MTVTIATVAATVAADIKAFRSSAVTTDGKGDSFARSLLASMLSGSYTQTLAESAIIHAFGNPKSPRTAKPVTKLSGLRDFKGGDAVRKAAETVFNIFANVDADKANEDGIGASTIRPLVVAFVLNQADAPKSLRALDAGVKAAIKVHAAALSPDNSEAETETATETADATPSTDATTTETLSLVDRINALTVAIQNAPDDDLNDAYAAFELTVAAYDARINAATATDMAQAA